MSDSSPPETNHLKVDRAAYRQLTRRAIGEVIRCLLATEAPSDLTMDKVRDRVRIFAASSTEPWARSADVIQPKTGDRGIPPNVLQKEYCCLIRALRDQLIATLLSEERAVWQEARKRMISQAEYGVFCVTESTVSLHRLMPTKKHNRHG